MSDDLTQEMLITPRLVEFDANELAARMAERWLGVKRPTGCDPEQFVDSIDNEKMASIVKTLANVAMDYVIECHEQGARRV